MLASYQHQTQRIMSILKRTSKKAAILSKRIAMVLTAVTLFGTVSAKGDPTPEKTEASVVAQYGDSELDLQDFISDNLVFPEVLRKEGLEARVEVEFVVDRTGNVRDVVVLASEVSGVNSNTVEYSKARNLFESAAKDAVLAMDQWSPSRIKGQAVDQRFRLPIRFEIQG